MTIMSRIPEGRKLRSTGTQYSYEYTKDVLEAAYECYNAAGDSVILLKKEKVLPRAAEKELLSSGERGKFGGRRRNSTYESLEADTEFMRPEKYREISIPASVETSPSVNNIAYSGIIERGKYLVRVSSKFLSDNNIVIDPGEDRILYKGVMFRISDGPDPSMNFLDVFGELVFSIERYSG